MCLEMYVYTFLAIEFSAEESFLYSIMLEYDIDFDVFVITFISRM